MKKVLCLVSVQVFIFYAHSQNGIKFIKEWNLTAVLQRAAAENKSIFMDCYATWCAPCKAMERNVFSDSIIVDYLNKNFICLRVQIDSSASDEKDIIAEYQQASEIKTKYNIWVVPTFLFISSSGKLVHAGAGYKGREKFLDLLKNAMDTSTQYYTLLESYRKGKKNYQIVPYLVEVAKELRDEHLMIEIVNDYVANYLLKSERSVIFQPKNLKFIASYVSSEQGAVFDLFYRNATAVDSALKEPKFSQSVVDRVLMREEIYPYIWKTKGERVPVNKEPDWEDIKLHISRKYDSKTAARVLYSGKIVWYEAKKDWKNLIKVEVERIHRYGLDTLGIAARQKINYIAWSHIFEHSNDKKMINEAIAWMKVITSDVSSSKYPLYPNWLDTYANLLYKSGRKKEGMEIERQAASLASNDKEIHESLERMEKGLPTWGFDK